MLNFSGEDVGLSKSWQSLSWASAKVRFYNFHFSYNKLLNYSSLIISIIITMMIFIFKTYIQDAEAVERTGRSRRALIITRVTWLLRIRQSQMPPLSEVSFLESLSFLQAHFLATLLSLWLPSPPLNPGSPLPPSSPHPPSSPITQPAPIFNQHRDFRNYPLMMSPPSLTIFCRNSNFYTSFNFFVCFPNYQGMFVPRDAAGVKPAQILAASLRRHCPLRSAHLSVLYLCFDQFCITLLFGFSICGCYCLTVF